jgi:hypothetical protein
MTEPRNHKRTGAPLGRPPHKPSVEIAARIALLTAKGETLIRLAEVIGFPHSTIEKYYRAALEEGRKMRDDQVLGAFIKRCLGFTDPKGKYIPPDPTCLTLYAKTRLGFKDVSRLELTGKGGAPISVQHSLARQLSDEQLAEQLEAHARLLREKAEGDPDPTAG